MLDPMSKMSSVSLPPTITGMLSGSMISVSSLYPDDGRRQILSCDLLSMKILTQPHTARAQNGDVTVLHTIIQKILYEKLLLLFP
jgi:hypothetical protein